MDEYNASNDIQDEVRSACYKVVHDPIRTNLRLHMINFRLQVSVLTVVRHTTTQTDGMPDN
jgi:hypothetical protein